VHEEWHEKDGRQINYESKPSSDKYVDTSNSWKRGIEEAASARQISDHSKAWTRIPDRPWSMVQDPAASVWSCGHSVLLGRPRKGDWLVSKCFFIGLLSLISWHLHYSGLAEKLIEAWTKHHVAL
jgi:hypothetical protein